MANAPPPFHMQTRARAGVAVPSRQKVEIDLANEYDYIINNLIEKDPETFPEPQALIQHVRELKQYVDQYVENSLTLCQMVKGEVELFRLKRRERTVVRKEGNQYIEHANIILSSQNADAVSLIDINSVRHSDESLLSTTINVEYQEDDLGASAIPEAPVVSDASHFVPQSSPIHFEQLLDNIPVPPAPPMHILRDLVGPPMHSTYSIGFQGPVSAPGC